MVDTLKKNWTNQDFKMQNLIGKFAETPVREDLYETIYRKTRLDVQTNEYLQATEKLIRIYESRERLEGISDYD